MFDLALLQIKRDSEIIFYEVAPVLWTAKLAGALAGSLISIAYVLPRNRREAFLRLAVGVATGVVFGGTAGVKLFDMLGLLGKISVVEMTLVGAAFCSLSAWWGLGVLRRLAEHWAGRKLNQRLQHIGSPPPASAPKAKENDE